MLHLVYEDPIGLKSKSGDPMSVAAFETLICYQEHTATWSVDHQACDPPSGFLQQKRKKHKHVFKKETLRCNGNMERKLQCKKKQQ